MNIAISRSFTKAKHRFCMWHIMKKLNDKVDMKALKDTEFLDKIHACVWSVESEPSEFEESWKSIIQEFGLEKNDWLQTMFKMRELWIPTYFRDLFMARLLRTTSCSESENSFFNEFTGPILSLVEY